MVDGWRAEKRLTMASMWDMEAAPVSESGDVELWREFLADDRPRQTEMRTDRIGSTAMLKPSRWQLGVHVQAVLGVKTLTTFVVDIGILFCLFWWGRAFPEHLQHKM